MAPSLLLCTDLDRTLLPNGAAPESPQARRLFTELVSHAEIRLAFVTGRDRERVEHAIELYGLPLPDYVIGDVGTTIYELADGPKWSRIEMWDEQIGHDWADVSREELGGLLANIGELRLQEASKQNRFKLSYYTPLSASTNELIARIDAKLSRIGIRYAVVCSVDEPGGVGLLDILPGSATKRHAIEFLMNETGFNLSQTVFCGDSGNDLSVLASEIPGVLVANASPAVRRQAIELARQMNCLDALYIAKGSFLGLNGNYAAGILEGVVHYYPDALEWISAAAQEVSES